MRAALAVPSEVVQFLRISNAGIIVIVIVIIVVGLHAASSLAKASATVHTHMLHTQSHTQATTRKIRFDFSTARY